MTDDIGPNERRLREDVDAELEAMPDSKRRELAQELRDAASAMQRAAMCILDHHDGQVADELAPVMPTLEGLVVSKMTARIIVSQVASADWWGQPPNPEAN